VHRECIAKGHSDALQASRDQFAISVPARGVDRMGDVCRRAGLRHPKLHIFSLAGECLRSV
jgi:hypothetical protein